MKTWASECGAKCHLCPLQSDAREQQPVEGDLVKGASVVIVGRHPGRDESIAGRAYVGPSGMILEQSLESLGVSRQKVSVTYAVACRPPKDDLKGVVARINKENRKRHDAYRARRKEWQQDKVGPEPMPPQRLLNPIEACRERVLREIYPYQHVITLGADATNIVSGHKGGIMGVRGTFLEIPETGLPLELDAEPWEELRNVPGRKIMPTFSPGYLLHRRRWETVFVADLFRAFRWFAGRAAWQEPEMLFRPSYEQLDFYLSAAWEWDLGAGRGKQRVHVYDFETDGVDTQTCNVRCIGIGGPGWAVVVPFLSVDGVTRLYPPHEEHRIITRLAQWAEDRAILKVGHNAGSFDRQVFEAWTERELGRRVQPAPLLDTIQLARAVFPELNRGLGFLGSFLIDIVGWKEEKGGLDLQTDEELWKYNGRDVAINARILLAMWERFNRLDAQVQADHGPQYSQYNLLILDHAMQSGCVGMERQGMLIDQKRREQHFVTYKAQMLLWANRAMQALADTGVDLSTVVKRSKTVRERAIEMEMQFDDFAEMEAAERAKILGMSVEELEEGWNMVTPEELGLSVSFNPGSHDQLRAVLFDHHLWDLDLPSDMQEKELFTSSGEVSTGDAVLRRLLMNRSIPHEQRKFIQAIRMYRRAAKVLGTYILPVRPLVGDEKLDRGCVLHLDGRVHPNWKNHRPVTGRFASARPNAQNWPAHMKDMIIAGPGHVLVGADMDQLELRIAAARWHAKAYLEAFAQGTDAHQVTMRAVFPEEFDALTGRPSVFGKKDFKKGGAFDAMRKLAKTVQYLSQYGGSLEALYRTLTAAEDKETGELIYAHLTLQDSARLQTNWKNGCPEFPRGWEAEMKEFQSLGYLIEPVTGRRRDFTDGGKLNEVVNFPIQASGAGIMNLIMQELMDVVGFGRWGEGTGIINQCHDSITLELPRDKAQWGFDLLTKHMTKEMSVFPGVVFTCEADIGIKEGDKHSRWSYT